MIDIPPPVHISFKNAKLIAKLLALLPVDRVDVESEQAMIELLSHIRRIEKHGG